MRIEAEIGTVLIKDSIWRNIKTAAGGGLLSHNMSDLKVIIVFRKRKDYWFLS